MCFGCAIIAGVVIASSQVVPVQSPTLSSEIEVTVRSKSLAAFTGTSQALTAAQRQAIKSFILDNSSVQSVICSANSLANDSQSVRNLYKARAKAACDYVKRIEPRAQTTVILKNTKSRTAAGRVSIQIRSVAEPPQKISPFLTPFPTGFTKDELVAASLAEVRRYMTESSKSKPAKLIFQDTIPAAERGWISKLVDTTMAYLPFTDGSVPVVVIGSTDAFINESLQQNGTPGYSSAWWCGSETTYERYCAGAGWGAMNYKDSIEKGLPISDAGKRAVVAHEMYHIWHKTVDGSRGNNNRDPRSPEGIPLWFLEGMANFMGFAIAHHDGATTYSAGRANQIDPYMRSSSVPLRDHIGWEISPYGIGQAASEYLVASIGVAKVFEIYRKVGSGKTFAAAFEESAGISLNDFYTRFEANRSNF